MEQALAIDLPITAVRDIEILNRDQVYTLIESFLATNGITGGSAVMVLSQSLLFEKQIVQDLSDETRRNAAIKEYIDNVPFEQTAYVSYPIETGIGVIATNEEFFVTFKKAFERKNISVNLILPVRAFGETQIAPQNGPDPQTASYLLQNADQAKQFAFHVSIPIALPNGEIGPQKKKVPQKPSKKLPVYLSIFGFLILVLVVMIIVVNQPPPNKPVATTANAQAPAAAPPAPAAESTGPAGLDRAAISIQIKTPALFRTRIDDIKSRLTAAGYSTVDVADAPAAERTVLLLDKSKLSAVQKTALETDMRTYFTDFTVQEVDQGEYPVQLVVGKTL
jgi:hypothetical protein